MKKLLVGLLVPAVAVSWAASANTYYVSSAGEDSHSGQSQKSAWKTLDRVNREPFQPGDSILFRAGDEWNGQLHPSGSGTPGQTHPPRPFWQRPLPVINLGDISGAAIKLTNQEWWEIHNLEVTSGAPPEPGKGRQGIVALAVGRGGFARHIVIADCYIHDIWGQLGGDGNLTGYNSAAIFVGPAMGGGGGRGNAGGASADYILVQSNRIERVDRCGIIVLRAHTNIVVRGNFMENLGGDGIFVSGCQHGLIEGNIALRTCMQTGDTNIGLTNRYNPHSAAMWLQNCNDTIMQFNEVYDTGRQKGNGDGEAYDFDFNCTNCVCQYNYSRNNHGLLLIMNRAIRNIARYNISENDQSHLVEMHGTIAEGNVVNNNVFYIDYGLADITYYLGMSEIDDAAKAQMGANFFNNIFYATGQGRFRAVYTYGSALDRHYLEDVKLPAPAPGTLLHHNWYFGPWLNGLPDDPEKQTGDPLFLAPGSGGLGLATLTGYQLRPGSPCLGTGLPVADNGQRDFFGNLIKPGVTSFGACEKAVLATSR